MMLYLAGLKSVDPTLREAAKIDGASERQTFFRVVFPVMRPINIVVLVITVIESLRAFDLAYIINRGLNGLELLSVLVTNNIIGEASRIGFGSPSRSCCSWSRRPDHLLPHPDAARGGPMTTASSEIATTYVTTHARGSDGGGSLLHVFLFTMAFVWLFPLLYALYTSFRPYRRHRPGWDTSRSAGRTTSTTT